MSCGQKFLNDYFLGIPIPAPSSKRLLSQFSRLDIQEALLAWFQLIHQNGSATIEDVYDLLNADPADPHFGPLVQNRMRLICEARGYNIRKLDEVPSRRPSRKGAPVALWGSKA